MPSVREMPLLLSKRSNTDNSNILLLSGNGKSQSEDDRRIHLLEQILGGLDKLVYLDQPAATAPYAG